MFADLKDEGCYGRGWNVEQKDEKDLSESVRSLMKIWNNMGADNTALGYSSLYRERR